MALLPLDLKLSSHFTVNDLIPTSTGINNQPPDSYLPSLKTLAAVLDKIYAQIGSFRIVSAYRNVAVNAAVGGAATSRHTLADAADLVSDKISSEELYAKILANSAIRNLLGEISFKIPQNAVHVTLPYMSAMGTEVRGSARIADNEGSSLVYHSIGADKVSEYLAKYGLSITAGQAALGMGILVLGAGALAIAFVLKK